MRRFPLSTAAVALVIALCSLAPAEGRSIDKLKLSEGYTELNTLTSPVLVGAEVAPLEFQPFAEGFDRSERMFQRRSGAMRGGVKAKLGPGVVLGEILADSLGTEAERLGFRTGPGGWKVGGTIRELVFESDAPSTWAMGVLVFYGHMVVELEITSPDGKETSLPMALYSYSVQGGMNVFKSARDALATHSIQSAHEILVRLNRTHFGAPPHPEVAAWVEELTTGARKDAEPLIYRIGLSGSADAVNDLLAEVEREPDEGLRAHLIEALAHIASEESIPTLARRYGEEDDDCRWATLKAMAYIGSEEALAVVREQGLNDAETYYRKVAQRILGP
jgi:hypothetical protein